jgi:hypothetical protein
MTFNYAGIDYYTATAPSKKIGMEWFSRWEKHREYSLKVGYTVKAVKRFGYNCVYINGLTWGVHDRNGYLVTSSGGVAGLTWGHVLPIASKITRVDFHYTFQSNKPIDLNKIYKDWLEEKPGKRKATMVQNSRGGETLYIGSRSSDQYGRFYNKTAEAALETENVYRLEVELKKPRADVAFGKLYKDLGRCSLKASDVRDYVCSWFDKRAVTVDVNFDAVSPIKLTKAVTSDDKKLVWLKTAVAPTLQDLMQRGRVDEVSQALGLDTSQYEQLSLSSLDKEERFKRTGREFERLGIAIREQETR